MKRLLCAILAGLTIIGLVGCGQTPTTVIEDPTDQKQVQENKLAQATADKANKVIEYINEYINAYSEFSEARQNGTKSSVTSGITSEELQSISLAKSFGTDGYINIGEAIAEEKTTDYRVTAEDYMNYSAKELLEINKNLDEALILATNEDVFNTSNLTNNVIEEQSQPTQEKTQAEEQKQETPKVEQERPQQQDDTDTYKQVIGRCEDFTKDVNFLAPQMEMSYEEGDFNSVISYCETLESSYQDLVNYQLPSEIWVPLNDMLNDINSIKSNAKDQDAKMVYNYIVLLQGATDQLKSALY